MYVALLILQLRKILVIKIICITLSVVVIWKKKNLIYQLEAYLYGDIVFYKGKFEYDDEVMEIGLKQIVKIKEELAVESMEIYFGERVDYRYGRLNEVMK